MEKQGSSVEMSRFYAALNQVVHVSKQELNRLLAEEKAAKDGKVKPGPKPKTLPLDRVSGESD